jgi:hypothetical protein
MPPSSPADAATLDALTLDAAKLAEVTPQQRCIDALSLAWCRETIPAFSEIYGRALIGVGILTEEGLAERLRHLGQMRAGTEPPTLQPTEEG